MTEISLQKKSEDYLYPIPKLKVTKKKRFAWKKKKKKPEAHGVVKLTDAEEGMNPKP